MTGKIPAVPRAFEADASRHTTHVKLRRKRSVRGCDCWYRVLNISMPKFPFEVGLL